MSQYGSKVLLLKIVLTVTVFVFVHPIFMTKIKLLNY